MVDVAQLARALVCGTRGQGFEPLLPPFRNKKEMQSHLFFISARPLMRPRLFNDYHVRDSALANVIPFSIIARMSEDSQGIHPKGA